jgi:hypothetical protein
VNLRGPRQVLYEATGGKEGERQFDIEVVETDTSKDQHNPLDELTVHCEHYDKS